MQADTLPASRQIRPFHLPALYGDGRVENLLPAGKTQAGFPPASFTSTKINKKGGKNGRKGDSPSPGDDDNGEQRKAWIGGIAGESERRRRCREMEGRRLVFEMKRRGEAAALLVSTAKWKEGGGGGLLPLLRWEWGCGASKTIW
ncbi:unnamed protein product [Linum trigynum]|uniref:Uncharacterized protein n=1 Tax=Linum trigynum TaxID=586398 RepID=A0AAV2GSP2_9ROSI